MERDMENQQRYSVFIWMHLGRILQKINLWLSRQLELYDLTPAQFDVLVQLHLAPDISQQMLADRLLVTKGNIVGLLDRLERADLVERRADPTDGRAHVISLTERGANLVARVIPEHEALIAKYMASLPFEDQRTLHRLLRTLDHGLKPD
jgi:DNA-binding MarR family transcriptional regulator